MKRILTVAQKFNWLVVVVLVLFTLRLYSHKKSLHSEVNDHKENHQNLLQRVAQLDSNIAQKSRELNEVQRLHGQAAQTANQVIASCSGV